MVTYRGVVRSNRVGTQDRIQPSFVLEVKRDSKKARAEAEQAFYRLMSETLPDAGAVARLSITDSSGYTTWLHEFTGRPTARTRYSMAVASGTWTDGKVEVLAGIPADDPRLDQYLAAH